MALAVGALFDRTSSPEKTEPNPGTSPCSWNQRNSSGWTQRSIDACFELGWRYCPIVMTSTPFARSPGSSRWPRRSSRLTPREPKRQPPSDRAGCVGCASGGRDECDEWIVDRQISLALANNVDQHVPAIGGATFALGSHRGRGDMKEKLRTRRRTVALVAIATAAAFAMLSAASSSHATVASHLVSPAILGGGGKPDVSGPQHLKPGASSFSCQGKPIDGSQGIVCYSPAQIQQAYATPGCCRRASTGRARRS